MEIPFRSKFLDHAAPCTAWGSNQKKFAMTTTGDIYSAYMDNDEELGFRVFRYRFDNWTRGVKLRAQRPGNVLLDCWGNLHVFVVDGRQLNHHVFRGGDIRKAPSSSCVTSPCNIRFSVDIRGPRVFVAFGQANVMTFVDGYMARSGDVRHWRVRRSSPLPVNFVFPQALIRSSGKLVALAEDDENRMAALFHEDDLDLPHVLSNALDVHANDVFECQDGVLHALVRGSDCRFMHAREIEAGSLRFARSTIATDAPITHLRFSEDMAEGLHLIGASWDKVWKGFLGCALEDITPAEVEKCEGIVPFVVDADVLLLPSSEDSYPDAKPWLCHTGINVAEYKVESAARCNEWIYHAVASVATIIDVVVSVFQKII